VRLAGEQLLLRMASDWSLAALGDAVEGLGSAHALLTPADVASVVDLMAAARSLAVLEDRVPVSTCGELVDDLYPSHYARVPELISRAELAAARGDVLGVDGIDAFRAAARRALHAVDAAFAAHADDDFEGCLRI